jgi:hypothetical protein
MRRDVDRQIRLLIPLAFLPPDEVRQLVDGRLSLMPTDLVSAMPIFWNG